MTKQINVFLLQWDLDYASVTWEDSALAKLDERLGKSATSGEPIESVWTPHTLVRDEDECGLPVGDFFFVDGGFVGIGARVPFEVRATLGKFGELLPCRVEDLPEDFVILNVTNKKPIVLHPGGPRRWTGTARDFDVEQLQAQTVVRDLKALGPIYWIEDSADKGLRHACEELRLTGLQFQQVFPWPDA